MMFRVCLAVCAMIGAVSAQVSQVRLAYIPNGMVVSWTQSNQSSTNLCVNYGVYSGNLSSLACGTTSSYGTDWFVNVPLTGLAANTQYFYNIVGGGFPTTPFTTARAKGDSSAFNVLVVGDLGLDNAADTMTCMNKIINQNDFVYHLGDLSYADDWYLRGDSTYESSWTEWQNEMQPITSIKAYMTMPGNHEASCTEVTPFLCPAEQKNFTAYRYRFRMPSDESGAVGAQSMYSSFDFGMAHFVSVSTETDIPGAAEGPGTWMSSGPFGDQLAWLEADLASVNRSATPWVIISGHRPLYSSGGSCDVCRNAFETLFNKYKVDVYLAGHVHWYERLYSIAPGGSFSTSYNNPSAPVYLVNGAAGNVEGHSVGFQQNYTAMIDNTHYGYSTMNFASPQSLTWNFFDAASMSLIDTVTITKS